MNESIGKRRALVLLALTVAVALAFVLVAERFAFRIDLTADRANGISKVARSLYKEIPERVRVSYYISSSLADRHPGPRAVEDLLREVEAASRGKISVEVIDPGKSGEEAERLGLAAQRMQVVEQNEQRVALVFSGIVFRYLDRTETIPFVIGTETLEYDLIKAVRRAVSAKKTTAAVLLGDPDKSLENDYRTLSESLRRSGWTLVEAKPGSAVPPETDVLIVIGNSALDDYDSYRVDEYLARGGSVLFAVKGVDVEARQSLTARPLAKDALIRSLAAYGVKVAPSLVLDQSSLTVPFQVPGQGGGLALRYVRYPHWVVVRPENAERGNPLTARLAGLDLFWPSPLELAAPAGVTAAPLASSTSKAWLMTKNFAVAPEEDYRFAEEAPSTTRKYLLAASLSGVLPMAYAGKPLPTREGAEALQPLPAVAKPSRAIVIGSSDFANDLMTMTDSTFNAEFLANAAEWLASGDELASIRSRGARDPRLVKIQDPAARSLAILGAYALNLFIVPGGFVLYGLLRARKRRLAARAEQPAVGVAGVAGGAVSGGAKAAAPATAEAPAADKAAGQGEEGGKA